jgi:hypothetical protein
VGNKPYTSPPDCPAFAAVKRAAALHTLFAGVFKHALMHLLLQVPALWPPDAYEAHWLMTPDNHIAGLDSLPLHVLLDRQVWVGPEVPCGGGRVA